MRGWFAVVVVASVACGRLNYDEGSAAIAGQDASADMADARVAGDFIVGFAQITAAGDFSFVNLDVNWSRNLAYVSSRKSDECVLIIDIADRSGPVLLGEIAPPQTMGGTCIGLKLVGGGTELVVGSQSGASVELWALGDPRVDTPARTDQLGFEAPRRIAHDGANRVYVAKQSGSVQTLDMAGGVFSLGPNATVGACEVNQVVYSDGVVVATCYDNNSPIQGYDATFGDPYGAPLDMTAAGTTGTWCGAGRDGTGVVFQGGWVSALVDVSAGNFEVVYRWDNEGVYRGADMGDGILALAQANGDSEGGNYIELWELASGALPQLVGRGALPNMGREAYEVRIDPLGQQAVVAGNDGQLAIVDLGALPAPEVAYPTF